LLYDNGTDNYNRTLRLPDGGAKLRAKLEEIKSILNSENTLTKGITDKVSGLSLNEKLDIRKETVIRSNNVQEVHAHNLLRAHDADEQHVSLYIYIYIYRYVLVAY
jgi:hypothetical protein